MWCHYCGQNPDTLLRRFGRAELAVEVEEIKGPACVTVVFRGILFNLHIPEVGVLRDANTVLNGIVRVLMRHGGGSVGEVQQGWCKGL